MKYWASKKRCKQW